MLILTRKTGERVRIELHPGVDPATPAGELFKHGPIEVTVTRINALQVRLGIEAHPCLVILRGELGPPGAVGCAGPSRLGGRR